MRRHRKRGPGIATPHALAMARHRAPVDLNTCGTFRGLRYLRTEISKRLEAWYRARPKIPFTDEKIDAITKRIRHTIANAALIPMGPFAPVVGVPCDQLPPDARLVPMCRNCEHDADEHTTDGECHGTVFDYGGPFDCGCKEFEEDVVTINFVTIEGTITP